MKKEFPFDDEEFDSVTCSMSIFYAQYNSPGEAGEVHEKMKGKSISQTFSTLRNITLHEIKRVLEDSGPFVVQA